MGEPGRQAPVVTRIAAALAGAAAGARVAEARLGLGYTAIRLDDGRTGLAYTLREGLRSGCTVFDRLRPLAGRGAGEVLALLSSDDALGRAVGLACANALANGDRPALSQGDVLEHLDLRATDDVAMIGHFSPLVGPIQARARSLVVVDGAGTSAGQIRLPAEAEDTLRGASVALVTATTLLNGTLDALLLAAAGCREVVLLGASTPLVPDFFRGGPVTLLSGVVVTDPHGVLAVVSEGGGTRLFRPHVKKVVLRVGVR
jgi:uncharacterized protein (DUF4213/DUF364 family)